MGKCSSEQEAIDKKNYLISLNFAPPDSIIIHPSNRQENNAIYGTVAVGTPIGTDTFIKEFMQPEEIGKTFDRSRKHYQNSRPSNLKRKIFTNILGRTISDIAWK